MNQKTVNNCIVLADPDEHKPQGDPHFFITETRKPIKLLDWEKILNIPVDQRVKIVTDEGVLVLKFGNLGLFGIWGLGIRIYRVLPI